MLLSSDSCKKVQGLIVKGKYQSSVICGLTALRNISDFNKKHLRFSKNRFTFM